MHLNEMMTSRIPGTSGTASTLPKINATTSPTPLPSSINESPKGALSGDSSLPQLRAIEAISGFVDTAASIGHEVLSTGVDLLQFAPVPGLQLAGNILLNIWDAVGMVKVSVMSIPFAALVPTADLSRQIVSHLCAWPNGARQSSILLMARSPLQARL
jgi:hypothetical protein